ncbi:hypothetical protein HELRODRAFT_182702 [Helobdella robusta]|uniref:Alpha galactosidase C-terminal domain-containing protein n=1 Tax=Helobdella robusta TaxID=6412 RepID=T1FIL7_HELRO|nr:hypothetical protein HELRODRAFT_182702 [Helobdella robusta]ESN90205.1 hypothetical protein HELRODRAFT_182702 [Helobdella robusta]
MALSIRQKRVNGVEGYFGFIIGSQTVTPDLGIGNIDIWTKPLSTPNCSAFVFLNFGTSTPTKVSVKLSELGLQGRNGYKIYEVFSNIPFPKIYYLNSTFESNVNPSGVFFGKAIAL